MNHLLEIREAAFPLGGGVSSLSLCLDEGETRVILGSRESGLEETGRILTGEMTLPEGALLLDGSPAVFSCPTDALRRGCAKSLGVIETLSVRDHIRLLFPGARPLEEDPSALTEIFLPDASVSAPASALSPSEKLRLQLLLSALRGDRLLVLDDPLEGIPPAMYDDAARSIARRAAMGCCVTVLTRYPRHARLGKSVTVLRDGKAVYQGPSDSVGVAFLEQALDVGEHLRRDALRVAIPGGVVMEVRGLCSRRSRSAPAVRSVSFEIREGEITGLCAMKGQGGERLLEILAGLEKPGRGRVRLKGSVLKTHSYPLLHASVRYIPPPVGAPPRQLSSVTVRESLAMQCSRFSSLFVNGVLRPGRLEAYTRFILKEYPIDAGEDTLLSDLSPSDLRMLQEAPELDRAGNVLLLSHPSEPLNADRLRFLWSCLEEEKIRRTGILYLTDQVDEAMAVCDRILVMREGRIILACDSMNASRKQIAMAMSDSPGDSPPPGADEPPPPEE